MATGQIVAAGEQSSAAKTSAQLTTQAQTYAAQIQAKSAADTLAFYKQQAAQDLANANATAQANYNIWKLHMQGMSDLGQMVGNKPIDIPDFVPLTAVPDSSSSGTPSGTPTPTTNAPLINPITGLPNTPTSGTPAPTTTPSTPAPTAQTRQAQLSQLLPLAGQPPGTSPLLTYPTTTTSPYPTTTPTPSSSPTAATTTVPPPNLISPTLTTMPLLPMQSPTGMPYVQPGGTQNPNVSTLNALLQPRQYTGY